MKKRMVAFLAGAMLLMAAGSAWAVPTLRITDGINTVTVADGSGLDLSSIAGVVSYSGTIGIWDVNFTSGLTKPEQGTALVPYMDLVSLNHSTGAGQLFVYFSDTDFARQSGPALGITTEVGGTTQGTFELKSFYDKNNTLFGTGSALADLGPYSAGAFSGTATDPLNFGPIWNSNVYSLTLEAIINQTGASTTSFDAQLTPVPEPGTMMLLGFGMLGLAVYGKRRMNKEA